MAQQNIFGSTVRRIRVEKDLTQDAFAARSQLAGWDLSRESLSKIETCLRRVNDAAVMITAKIFGCKITDLSSATTISVLPVLKTQQMRVIIVGRYQVEVELSIGTT
ncbi:MAG: helix-turn-helix transcriptional regulator [Verrucomicrobia bacterium]|nr:helix-turn-helix transcriptional regulator [Verrucomicrobiota bacterium]